MSDITNVFEGYTNISKVGKYGKFANFIKVNEEWVFDPFNNSNRFSSDRLKCEKLDSKMKKESLNRIINSLEKHIDIETKKILERMEVKIKNKLRKKYSVNELRKKIYEVK